MKDEVGTSVKLRTGKYFVKEGYKNLHRNRIMSFTSISSVIASLLVVGIFFIIMLNVDYIASSLESQIEMRVYLQDGLSQNIVDAISKEIKALNGVKDIKYIPKAEALQDMGEKWGDNSYLLEGLEGDNPLPDTIVITLTDSRLASAVSLSVSAMSNVEKVIYGKEELQKLLRVTYVLRMSSLIIITILLFISIFIIANTIKLTVYARRREIGIMKFVGATDWFVRGPFIFEGMILGFWGGIISVVLLGAGYYYCAGFIKRQMLGFLAISLMPFNQVVTSLVVLLVAIGIFIGAIGSLISVRKFIRV